MGFVANARNEIDSIACALLGEFTRETVRPAPDNCGEGSRVNQFAMLGIFEVAKTRPAVETETRVRRDAKLEKPRLHFRSSERS